MWEVMCENPVTGPLIAGCTEQERSAVARSVLSTFEELAGAPDRPVRLGAS
jgi:hypothetical protein